MQVHCALKPWNKKCKGKELNVAKELQQVMMFRAPKTNDKTDEYGKNLCITANLKNTENWFSIPIIVQWRSNVLQILQYFRPS